MSWGEKIHIYEWLGDQSHQDEGSRITDGHKLAYKMRQLLISYMSSSSFNLFTPHGHTKKPFRPTHHPRSCSFMLMYICIYAWMLFAPVSICSCSCSAARSSVFDRSPLCSSTRTPTTMDHTYTYLSIGYLSLHSSTTINLISHACLAVLFSLPLELATTTTHFLFVSVSYPLSPVFFLVFSLVNLSTLLCIYELWTWFNPPKKKLGACECDRLCCSILLTTGDQELMKSKRDSVWIIWKVINIIG